MQTDGDYACVLVLTVVTLSLMTPFLVRSWAKAAMPPIRTAQTQPVASKSTPRPGNGCRLVTPRRYICSSRPLSSLSPTSPRSSWWRPTVQAAATTTATLEQRPVSGFAVPAAAEATAVDTAVIAITATGRQQVQNATMATHGSLIATAAPHVLNATSVHEGRLTTLSTAGRLSATITTEDHMLDDHYEPTGDGQSWKSLAAAAVTLVSMLTTQPVLAVRSEHPSTSKPTKIEIATAFATASSSNSSMAMASQLTGGHYRTPWKAQSSSAVATFLSANKSESQGSNAATEGQHNATIARQGTNLTTATIAQLADGEHKQTSVGRSPTPASLPSVAFKNMLTTRSDLVAISELAGMAAATESQTGAAAAAAALKSSSLLTTTKGQMTGAAVAAVVSSILITTAKAQLKGDQYRPVEAGQPLSSTSSAAVAVTSIMMLRSGDAARSERQNWSAAATSGLLSNRAKPKSTNWETVTKNQLSDGHHRPSWADLTVQFDEAAGATSATQLMRSTQDAPPSVPRSSSNGKSSSSQSITPPTVAAAAAEQREWSTPSAAMLTEAASAATTAAIENAQSPHGHAATLASRSESVTHNVTAAGTAVATAVETRRVFMSTGIAGWQQSMLARQSSVDAAGEGHFSRRNATRVGQWPLTVVRPLPPRPSATLQSPEPLSSYDAVAVAFLVAFLVLVTSASAVPILMIAWIRHRRCRRCAAAASSSSRDGGGSDGDGSRRWYTRRSVERAARV